VPRGVTFLELLAVLVITGVLLGLAIPRVVGWLDRTATRRAAAEVRSFYHDARLQAVLWSARVRLELGEDSLRAVFEQETDSVFLARVGPGRHGVRLMASRSVIRVAPSGMGWGAANAKLVLRRGGAAESLTVSRLGRLKWWR
jgi:prepilin-type N-terminal cleavage/methylation domain-containing protein